MFILLRPCLEAKRVSVTVLNKKHNHHYATEFYIQYFVIKENIEKQIDQISYFDDD